MCIPVETLHALLRLDPETGRLYWRSRPREMFATQRGFAVWNARYAEREAFTFMDVNGYRLGRIFRRSFLAHRVIFAMVNGRWPAAQVDHRDCDRGNNRPDNLRDATHAENCRNQSAVRGGSSAFKGVTFCKRTHRWIAQVKVRIDGKKPWLGRHDTQEAAARAYDAFAAQHFGEFARLNFPIEEAA